MVREICTHCTEEYAPTAEEATRARAAAEMVVPESKAAITRALGGSETSVLGMAGAGDLYVTSLAGRNSRLGNHLGRGLTYRQTKDGPMKDETIEGAELGINVGETLRAMMKSGALDARALPLTSALLEALTRDAPLDIPWTSLHRHN